MSEWLLIYLPNVSAGSPHGAPEGPEGPFDELPALSWVPGDEVHRRFLHGGHRCRPETPRESAQRLAAFKIAQGRVDCAALGGGSGARLRRDYVGNAEQDGDFALFREFNSPIE